MPSVFLSAIAALALNASVATGWHDGDGWTIGGGGAPRALPEVVQDFDLTFELECPSDCRGVIVLASANGGTSVLVDLADSGRGGFVAVPAAGGGFTRGAALAVGPSPFAAAPGGFPLRAGARPRATTPSKMPGPVSGPLGGGWHRTVLSVRRGILSLQVDGEPIAKAGMIMPEDTGAVRIRFLSDAARPVRYRGVSVVDRLRGSNAVRTDPRFTVVQPSDLFLTEAIAAGDINRDSKPDLVAGPNIYFGPDFRRFARLYPERPAAPNFYQASMVSFVSDFTGDGWPDVLEFGLPMQGAVLYVNPQGASRYWEHRDVIPSAATEIAALADIDGDGRAEVVFGRSAGPGKLEIGYAAPNPAAPAVAWKFTPVSTAGAWSAHGLGVGDVNGDGRVDIVNSKGWWQAPTTAGASWIEHTVDFGSGAAIGVTDMDGDGITDIVTSLDAHGWGLAWFKGARGTAGDMRFERRMIMAADGAPGSAAFSELHALALADIDGDGRKDIVTGKRWWAHLDGEGDPDPFGAPVVYWFRQTGRGAAIRFEPHEVHNRSGVGAQLLAQDLNGDGRADIAVTNRRGTFVFLAKPRR
jgi:hypothetical protein